MTLLERLIAIRTGGGVQRCHGIMHRSTYNVDGHTWGLLVLLFLLWPKDFPRLSAYALFHDVPEAWVGDIPAPVKKYCPAVKSGVGYMEGKILERLELPDDAHLPPEDRAKLKACDSLELYLWALEEVYSGNKHADCVRRELEGFFARDPLLPEAHQLYQAIKHGSVEHATDAVIRELNGVA